MTRITNVTNTTKFKRSIKAISPVIATLLMIAIAVVASLVAYAWVMGYMGFTTNNAGKAIQLPSFAIDANSDLLVYVQNTGQGTVTISSVYVNDESKPFTPDPNYLDNVLPMGKTAELVVTGPFAENAKLDIKVTTTDGTFMQITRKVSGSGGGVLPVPALSTFTFDVIGSQQVNNPFSIVVTAKDQFGAIFDFDGLVTLSDSTGTINPTSVTLTNGVSSSTPVSISSALASVSISASGGGKTGASNTFQVSAAPPVLSRFTFDTIGNQINGAGFSITIRAIDQYGDPFTSYVGTNTLTVSAGSINPLTTSAFTAGVWTSTVTITGTGTDVTISTSGSGQSGTSSTFDVNNPAPILSSFVIGAISGQTTGQAFNIVITAKDQYGATFTSFTGTVSLVAMSGITNIPINPAVSGSFVGGVRTESVTINQAASGIVITASGSGATGDSNSFTVTNPPAALHHFNFATISTPQTTGTAFSITITAIDQYGATFTGYTGTNTLTYSGGTINPTTTGAFVAGVKSGLSVTLTGTGTGVSLSTAAQSDNTKTGTSNTFNVNAPSTVAITITSKPTGSGYVTVDGTPITTPQTFNWLPGSSHTIAANSPVTPVTDLTYTYLSWSDGGSQSHSYTVPGSPTTVTASYNGKLTLRPNAAGTTTELENSGSGGADWDRVDEVIADDGTTNVYGDGDDYRQTDTYNIANPSVSGTITNVGIYVRCHESSDRDDVFAWTAAKISGGSIQYGTQIGTTTTWTPYNTNYAVKTGSLGSGAWTWVDVNNLEIGVGLQSHQSGSNWRYAECTQVWVEITFTPT